MLEFRPLPGYLQPPNETVVVISGAGPVVLERAYTTSAATGSGGLMVTLKPANLADPGAPVAGPRQAHSIVRHHGRQAA